MFQSIDTSKKRVGDHDVFDCYDESYEIGVTKSPSFVYSTGSDWKKNLVSKASRLNWYKNLIVHDNNERFCFDDSCYDYIYSNSAYWVSSFDSHIKDLIRILKPGGHLVLELKTSAIERFMLGNYAPSLGVSANNLVDAGRRSTWKGLRSLDDYCRFFDEIPSVEVVRQEPVYGGFVSKLWDIGLRPLFNPLSSLANSCDPEIRLNAKIEWNNTLFDMFSDFVDNYSIDNKDAIEHLFVLKKK